jgi:hypothetical protein
MAFYCGKKNTYKCQHNISNYRNVSPVKLCCIIQLQPIDSNRVNLPHYICKFANLEQNKLLRPVYFVDSFSVNCHMYT